MRPTPRILAGMLLLLPAAVPLRGQSITTGAVLVEVRDAAGKAAANVPVVLRSSQVVRRGATGRDGRCLFPLLNPGTWRVSTQLPGHPGESRPVGVALNETVFVLFEKVQEASVTVEAGHMDPTASATGRNLTAETLEALPAGREAFQVVLFSPGVASAGFSANGLDISVNGASGSENSWNIDGLSATDFRYGGRGTSLAPDFIEQVDAQTGGLRPEFNALGGVFNVLTRSGSNDFRGSVAWTFTPAFTLPGPKRTAFTQEASLPSGADATVWVGGALVKDRLFYSVGALSDLQVRAGQNNLSGFPSDDARIAQNQFLLKLNAYLTPEQQFSATATHTSSLTHQPHAAPAGYGNGEVGATLRGSTTGISLGYDWIALPTLFISAKAGQSRLASLTEPTATDIPVIFDRHWFEGPTATQAVPGGGAGSLPPGLTDPTTIYQRGGYGLYTREWDLVNQQSLTVTTLLGTHTVKAGWSFLRSDYSLWQRVSGDHRYTIDQDGGRLRDRLTTNDATVRADNRALFLQDSWEARPDTTVFYGLRTEQQIHYGGDGRPYLKFGDRDTLQPRAGFTWDPSGKGLAKISGSYSVYVEDLPQSLAMNEFTGKVFKENRYLSTQSKASASGQYVYGSAPNSIGTYQAGRPDSIVDYGAFVNFPPIQDGIRIPRRKEWLLGYQQILKEGWTAAVNFKYRRLLDVLEDSVLVDANGKALKDSNGIADAYTMPGTKPAVLWNPGSTLRYWGKGPNGLPYLYDFTGVNTLFPPAGNVYRAVELSLERRSSSGFLSVTYVRSLFEGNYQGFVSTTSGQMNANITSSFDYWPTVGSGVLPLDRTHSLKLLGSRKLGAGELGANLLVQSGTPITHLDNGSATYGTAGYDFGSSGNTIPVNHSYGGYGRRPTQVRLDLLAAWTFSLANCSLKPSVDIFNVLNQRPATATVEQLTDSGGSPQPAGYVDSATAWQAGRTVRFGVKLAF